MRSIIRICLLYTTVLLASSAYSQPPDSVRIDDRPYTIREISDEKIRDFQQDGDFDYAVSVIPGQSVLDMIKAWLRDFFQKLFSVQVGNVNVVNIVIYAICILAASYAIYKLIEMKSGSVVANQSDDLPYNVHEENIHEMNFEQLIRDATSKKQYRIAIRLTYLSALKKLSDAQKITWEPGKTNHEYLTELNNDHLRDGFSVMSYYFDYAWYGEFQVSKDQLDKVTETFNSMKTGLE